MVQVLLMTTLTGGAGQEAMCPAWRDLPAPINLATVLTTSGVLAVRDIVTSGVSDSRKWQPSAPRRKGSSASGSLLWGRILP